MTLLAPGAAAPPIATAVPFSYNPFYPSFASGGITYSNNNRRATYTGTTNRFTVLMFPKPLAGVWYQEFEIIVVTGVTLGVISAVDAVEPTTTYADATAYGFSYYAPSGQKTTAGSSSAYGASATNGDKIGVILDGAAGSVSFTKNGSNMGVAFTGLTAALYVPFLQLGTGSTAAVETPVTDTYTIAGAAPWRGS